MKRNPNNPRDHGLPPTKVTGPPVATGPVEDNVPECPNCGCVSLMNIEAVSDDHPLMGSGCKVIYIGCPACPWASPAMVVRTHPENEWPVESDEGDGEATQ